MTRCPQSVTPVHPVPVRASRVIARAGVVPGLPVTMLVREVVLPWTHTAVFRGVKIDENQDPIEEIIKYIKQYTEMTG